MDVMANFFELVSNAFSISISLILASSSVIPHHQSPTNPSHHDLPDSLLSSTNRLNLSVLLIDLIIFFFFLECLCLSLEVEFLLIKSSSSKLFSDICDCCTS